MAFGAGQIAEAADVDDRDVVAPAPRDLRDRAALHLDGVRVEPLVQAPPRALGVDEAVAGQDRAEMNRGRPRSGADRGRQGLEHQALHRRLQARHQPFGHAVARRPVAAQRRPAAGLDVDVSILLLQAVVVLDVAGRDHDIADAQGGIEAARHAAQHQRAAIETVEQQGRRDPGIDLAGPQFDEHGRAAGDFAAPEGKPADFARPARLVGEVGELLGQGRYDAQKPVCHGRMGYKVAAFNAMDSVSTLPSHQSLRLACTDLALAAAREIMRIYAGDLGVRDKADKSPVTDADQAAEAIIVAGLRKLTPDTPVVAEEEMAAGRVPALDAIRAGAPFWLVDPLDGTKEFIKRNGEFTVNIALIEGGRPTLGIVLAPASETLWRGAADWAPTRASTVAPSRRSPRVPNPTTASPAAPAAATPSTATSISGSAAKAITVAERVQVGSSLKFCLIAEGKADIYPRFGPTNEWDTAAGQGVLEAAGGEVVTTDGEPLLYGKPRFSNPHFIARSKALR